MRNDAGFQPDSVRIPFGFHMSRARLLNGTVRNVTLDPNTGMHEANYRAANRGHAMQRNQR